MTLIVSTPNDFACNHLENFLSLTFLFYPLRDLGCHLIQAPNHWKPRRAYLWLVTSWFPFHFSSVKTVFSFKVRNTKKNHSNTKTIVGVIVVFLIAIAAATIIFTPQLFLNRPNQNTILTPPQNIYVQVQDSANIVGDKFNGGYWVFNVAITANDDIAGVVLPKDQETTITYQSATQTLKTGAKIEFKFDPGTPYIIRTIQEKQVMIAPGATGAGTTKDPVYMRYYDWGEATWRIYTPFTVTVYKDGELIGTGNFNLEGAASVQTIDTSEGPIRLEFPGMLSGNYLSPTFPSQIAILKGYSNVYDYTQIQSYINGATIGSGTGNSATTYASYWYGNTRNSNNQATNLIVTFGVSTTTAYQPSKYGGWSGSDSGTNVTPVQPVIGQADKSTLPSGKASYYSLTEYIEQAKGIQNLASTLFNTRASGDVGALWQKASFTTDTNGQTALRLDIPWSAFGTPLVNVRVPTELADTWIDRPTVANAQITAVWESTGTDHVDVYGSNRIKVTVTNTGTATATASTKLYASSGNSKLTITPSDPITVTSLEPNVPQTFYYSVTNLGVESETANIPVTITASRHLH